MKDNTSVLQSDYIVDGTRQKATPAAMLDAACERETQCFSRSFEPIVDETADPKPFTDPHYPENLEEYTQAVLSFGKRSVPLENCGDYTKALIAKSLIDTIWRDGHFRLGDLTLDCSWKWNCEKLGSMAAFYHSVENACDFLDALGIRLGGYECSRAESSGIEIQSGLSDQQTENEDEDSFFSDLPFKTEHPVLKACRKCPEQAKGTKNNWLIYIAFDTCSPQLGNSLFSEATGLSCGKSPAIEAPDYFIDCYEVIRELVEDGIVLSGVTVSDGGIMMALHRMMPEGRGFNAEVGGIMKSYSENDLIRTVFSEIPGVIIEISDDDYDYVDAELLLQDVAYYPLGRFDSSVKGLNLLSSDNSDISEILHSLLNGQVSEGED